MIKGAIDELYVIAKSKPIGSYMTLPLANGYVSTTVIGWAQYYNPLCYTSSVSVYPSVSYNATTGIVAVS